MITELEIMLWEGDGNTGDGSFGEEKKRKDNSELPSSIPLYGRKIKLTIDDSKR
jgi:hypothetical protein